MVPFWREGGGEDVTPVTRQIGETGEMTAEERAQRIESIAALPARLAALLAGATEEELGRPYKAGGWNARQVVHHLADSHMNAYIRCKLTATEERPTLKPYDQEAWAELEDAKTGPLEPTLAILGGLHARWAAFLRALPEAAWSRVAFHPENGEMSLETLLRGYAGHGEKHLEHIRTGLGR